MPLGEPPGARATKPVHPGINVVPVSGFWPTVATSKSEPARLATRELTPIHRTTKPIPAPPVLVVM